MIVIPGKIPILIHPFFWLLAGLIGILYGGFSLLALIWVVIVFISVLFHEYGHALTAKVFGQHPQISLVALGGLTTYEGKGLNFFKQFIIVLNGPIFGFILCGLSYFVLSADYFTNNYIVYFFSAMWIVNLFWSVANLVPVLPLDGGQLLRIVLEGIFGTKGFRAAIFVSMCIAVTIALIALVFYRQLIFVAIIFFLFAFQNFEMFRQTRFISTSDRDDENREEIMLAEKALEEGNKQEAKEHFKKIREKKAEGLIYTAATQYLALLEFEEGNKKQSYELLLSIKDKLQGDAFLILHELAYEFENYELVTELSQKCFQQYPCQKTALTNARAYAKLNQPKHAGGWLQTAREFGQLDLAKILEESVFQEIKQDQNFRQFLPDDFNEK